MFCFLSGGLICGKAGFMNRMWTRLMRSTYRKEPISSFILTIGLVDAVMGGVSGHGLLMILGLSMAGVAMALRWRMVQRQSFEPIEVPQKPPMRYLPEKASRPSLPKLVSSRKH